MTRIDSLEQYNSLIRDYKLKFSDYFSNNYQLEMSVGDSIRQGTLYYTQYDTCLQLFLFRDKYFVLYLYINSDTRIVIEDTKLPVLVYVIRREGDTESGCEPKLIEAGFVKKCTLQGFDYDPAFIYKEIGLKADDIGRRMQEDGFMVISPDRSEYEKFVKFIDGISEIPFWELERCSKKEFAEDSHNGLVRLLVDSQGEICGAYYRYVQGMNEYGWIAVASRYRRKTGFGLVLAADIMKGMLKRGHLGKDWIEYNNADSLRFHNRLGYKFNRRIREEYLLFK